MQFFTSDLLKWFVYWGLSKVFSLILFWFFFYFFNKITFWFAALIQSLVVIFVGKWYFNLKLEDIKSFLFKDLKNEDWKKIFKVTFFMVVAVCLIQGMISWYYVTNLKSIEEEENWLFEFGYLNSSLDFFVFWLSSFLLGPFSEELLYRKGLFEILLKESNYIFSIIISSLVFALMHPEGSTFINAFICGLFLAFLYKETKCSLIAVFVSHSIYNVFSFIIALLAFLYG